MEHRAVDDGAGEVRGVAAVAGQFQFDAGEQAVVVETHVVLDVEGVALAGDAHVFHARQAHLGRAPGVVCNHRAEAGRAGRLGFLAAEAATHAAHVDDDPVHGHAQHLGHQLLHLGGVLRGGIDNHAAIFSGHHRGNLGFQVEVLLAADVQGALQAVLRRRQGAAGITALVLVAVQHEVLLAQGVDHVEHRLQVLVFDDRRHGRLACGFQAVGADGQYHLADVFDLAVSQQRVAGHHRADVQLTGHVLGGDGDGHARELVAGRGIDAGDARVGAVAHAGIDVQLVGEFQAVVDVHRLARDVLGRALVLDALADAGGDVGTEQFGEFFLGLVMVVVRHRRSPGFPLLGIAARGRTCAAGSARSAGGIPCWRGSPRAG
ncbi:hypothetical protein D3C84_575510 [compost metagenome]